jgi:oligoendopeptidase F
MGQIFDRSNRARLTQKNAEELILQSTRLFSSLLILFSLAQHRQKRWGSMTLSRIVLQICGITLISLHLTASALFTGETPRVISRSEQQTEDTWNLAPLFPGIKEWNEAFQKELSVDYCALVSPYKSLEKLNSQELRELLDLYENLDRNLDKLCTFAHLYHVQDVTNNAGIEAIQAATKRRQEFFRATSWIVNKILSHDKETLKCFVEAKELSPYSVYIQHLLRMKSHTLSDDQEALLSLSDEATKTGEEAFLSLTDGDFVFPDIEDSMGEKHHLSYTTLWAHMRSPDSLLRKNAYATYTEVYRKHENTCAQLLLGEVRRHLFYARARGYSSCLEAALFPNDIPTSVYHNLIATVRKRVDVLHRYVELLKKYYQLDLVHLYDLYPHTSEEGGHYSYDEAVACIVEACKPLGSDYTDRLKSGLTEDRWVDRYENAHKRSGANSNGCYDSPPYILMSYAGKLFDASMLAHEAGHSMHSELSRKQPYHYSTFPCYKYPIFIAEVASTFHEDLLFRHLLQQSQNEPSLQFVTLLEALDHIRMYLFDSVLCAEFELFIHECVEQGKPITPAILRAKNEELYALYYGKDFVTDDGIVGISWATVPHYYYNFYLYQYATGISAAQTLVERVLQGGQKERDAYLNFLQSGRSKRHIDLLRSAGVDMTSSEPTERVIERFDHLLDMFENLIAHS